MNTIKNKVLVCGSDNLTSLGIIRELGSHNIPFTFLALGKCQVVTKSIYCKDIIQLKNLDDCLRYLKENYNRETYKPILIFSSDRLAHTLDNKQDEFSKKYILPCTSIPGNLKYYINKFNMQTLAREIGITCLDSKLLTKTSSIDDIEYPCFIKPCFETPGHYNEFKYKICNNEKELRKVLKMVRAESKFVVQRLLKKDNELVVYGCRMRDGKTIISGVMYQDRFSESGFASHGYITNEIPSNIDIDKIKAFIETVDYYGPFDFEFGIENENAYFIETNFRCVGPTGFFDKSGASVVAAYVYSCAGLDYTEISTCVKTSNWCIDDMYDIENVITRRISYKQWKHDIKTANLLRYYDQYDSSSYIAEKQRRFIQILRNILLKRFRLYIVHFGEKLGLKK